MPLLAFERCSMHLHASLEDVQVLAEREGAEEARKMFHSFRRWSTQAESREPLWHAGQILGTTKKFAIGHLRESPAVGLYHTSLVFWAYAIIAACNRRVSGCIDRSQNATHNGRLVATDQGQTLKVQRFLHAGIGQAAITPIRKLVEGMTGRSLNDTEADLVALRYGNAVVQNLVVVLRARAAGNLENSPPPIEKLIECFVRWELLFGTWLVYRSTFLSSSSFNANGTSLISLADHNELSMSTGSQATVPPLGIHADVAKARRCADVKLLEL
ncbi:uncharacterized protein Z518_05625 [Rhinocladiella mackenziei CBS 650.93]|uniref:Uncharacterized protein n=1 Tax=Rhinocladiella mackenziei CBS 650.93 TaxID=1442369 RepID=A0A0D2J6R5_9EURO|nr:uncharacterized protein Z518_05625 [Rhinocladiella mackenziei CBS 650.93]KIX04755.1 hypothetical protein Z518_05625 [Rhinocladiella mackenziei CBS 650.93]